MSRASSRKSARPGAQGKAAGDSRGATGNSSVRLSKPLERAVGQGHPWIFRDAISGTPPAVGEVVTVLDRQGRFLARGLSEAGPIAVRVFTTEDRPVDEALLAVRLDAALTLRDRLAPADTDALRLIHGEGDRLPGVVCDRYADLAVLRYDGEAILRRRPQLEALLGERLRARGVSTLLLRSGRGEDKRVVPLFGALPKGPLPIHEHGMVLLVDVVAGQKTGMFLDHRPNRLRVRELTAQLLAAGVGSERGGPRVANLFGYTGGFSIAAGLGGAAEVVTVDVAAPALALAAQAWTRNGLEPHRHHGAAVEVERWLSERTQSGQCFDLLVADPPSFAPNKASRDKALNAYKAMHSAALPAIADGGIYLAASCSSQVDRAAFEETLRKAARGCRVELQVLERSGAGFDHPVPLGFVEGEYLVATICRVLR